MKNEEGYFTRKSYSGFFIAKICTLLLLIMAGLIGCSDKGSDNKVLKAVAIQPANNKLAVGKTQQFSVVGTYTDGTATPDLGPSASWSSSSSSVATITPQGMVTAVSAGPTTITAVLGNVSLTTTLTVPETTLASIAIKPSNPTIAINTSQQFTVIGAYSDGSFQDLSSGVLWTSSDTSKAVIAQDGKATAVASGTTTITAMSGSKSATTNLTITPASLLSIAVTPSMPAIAAGTTQQFSAIGTFSDSTTQNLSSQVTWASSDTSKATIVSSGKATAVANGSTTITATSGTISSTTTLNVTPAILLSIAVTPADPMVFAGITQQLNATGTFSDSTTQNLTNQVTWSSSDTSKAVIAPDGKMTSAAAGTTTITATIDSISGVLNLTVLPVSQAAVAGTWEGTYTIYDAINPSEIGTYTFRLVINQSGTGVTGTSSLRHDTIGQIAASGEFTEGKIVGSQIDFVFKYIDTKSSHEMVNIGSATITDTSMTGNVVENYSGGFNCSYIFDLKKK